MKIPEGSFKNKSFAIYGLGKTGQSAKKYLKKNRIKNFFLWDDSSLERKKNKVTNKILYSNQLDKVDYIIISPGIDIKKTIFKKKLIRNKKKIITDLDLFYLKNKDLKSIVVTGTNGKSTTCQ
jgi:UDP-N-acetylmuramoylalanine--D-glutamate ligase